MKLSQLHKSYSDAMLYMCVHSNNTGTYECLIGHTFISIMYTSSVNLENSGTKIKCGVVHELTVLVSISQPQQLQTSRIMSPRV